MDKTHSASEVVLLAALRLDEKALLEDTERVFTEWDLTVQAWYIDPKRYGMKGYTERFPDHKRLYAELAGDKPLFKKGHLERVRPNIFCLTTLGRAMATAMLLPFDVPDYEKLNPYLKSPVFLKWTEDYNPPATAVAASLALSSALPLTSRNHFEARIGAIRDLIRKSLTFCSQHSLVCLCRKNADSWAGPAMYVDKISLLDDFLTVIENQLPVYFPGVSHDETPKGRTPKSSGRQQSTQEGKNRGRQTAKRS